MGVLDENRVILTGENPFIRLCESDDSPPSTDASLWRVIFSPTGPGHALYLKSELTENRWRIYSDNEALARWLQSTVQGRLNAETSDTAIPIIVASFAATGDVRTRWTERVSAEDEEIVLTWSEIGDPLLLCTQPRDELVRPYGVTTVLIPALDGRISRNETEAVGRAWPLAREGRPFSTCALAFSESWTEYR
jgi:hypothetical protein